MPSALMIGGPAAGKIADVEDGLMSIHFPNDDGTYSLYSRSHLQDSLGNQHLVYTLAGSDPIIELMNTYKRLA